jgi:hypothetical protein
MTALIELSEISLVRFPGGSQPSLVEPAGLKRERALRTPGGFPTRASLLAPFPKEHAQAKTQSMGYLNSFSLPLRLGGFARDHLLPRPSILPNISPTERCGLFCGIFLGNVGCAPTGAVEMRLESA